MTTYRPRKIETQRFAPLLRQLTPPQKAHEQYLRHARSFVQKISETIDVSAALRFEFYPSELFSGRKFLLGYAVSQWMGNHFPGMNAVATDRFEFFGIKGPPIILLPEHGLRRKSRGHLSVIEHEIVHINQAILGCFPARVFPNNPNRALGTFISFVIAEYQANNLQLTRWPTLYPHREVDITLDHWCILRGYTQALETFLGAVLSGDVSVNCFTTVFENAEQTFPKAFAENSLDKAMVEWLLLQIDDHLCKALYVVAGRNSVLASGPNAKNFVKWLRKRPAFLRFIRSIQK